ncbi:beta-xylosidase [Thermoclostridium stercorarium subsp. thermolacticum DSM 2910]|jgi:beta-xylosidase|uniref:Beta-xylosidase n=2 Tax=Thermoclostridium stercorarium TaxID=1510 RepID=A0A1B1YB05_THEST|nr:glycoside hydrolase 43 family protein [Thermoclostridium stercorarium]ANW97946.1 beta-xylosidase [Thermoclostridium stercorarium subsp. thermolacticum DSM 2910]UZQ86106.1 glycoside hydrolase 43 family protein [Thermoclostridium stercorarium]BAC87941.1 beta-xylosidase [Thermoclostridium stercorarium]
MQPDNKHYKSAVRKWGDLGNGFYRNPVLNSDYSDPDVIRVGGDFYMVCSEFHYMGMPVLHSKDLVNWTIIGRVYDSLKHDPKYDNMEGYAKGSWAPAIRYHNGRFYVYFCTPDEGLFMSTATDPAGPWSPLHEVVRVAGWEDPCPFWDDDGNAYLGHSTVGAGPIIIHKMSPDGTKLLDDGVIVYVGKIAEGTKIYKRNGYYYLIIPEGGVKTGWQTVLRSKSIYGPYERKVVLQTGNTNINGPHQGALVELENGESWFMHFQDTGILGRVCHLQPVTWVDNWPLMGCDGEPVTVYRKPRAGKEYERTFPQTSDEFDGPELGLQWQWNHNPVNERWSLSKRPGYLTLEAMYAESLLKARNTLTQKLIGEKGTATTELNTENLKNGQRAGLAFLGGTQENWIGIVREGESSYIKAVTAGIRYHGPEIETPNVWFRAEIDLNGITQFYFSTDNENFIQLGGPCRLEAGFWKGARIALFSYNTVMDGGRADFNWFRYEFE